MTRDAFKSAMSDLIDSIVEEERELTDVDIDKLNDNLGDVAQEILDNEPDSDEDDAPESEK